MEKKERDNKKRKGKKEKRKKKKKKELRSASPIVRPKKADSSRKIPEIT